jgi:hypothetical protein
VSRREFSRRLVAAILLRATNDDGELCCEGCGIVLGFKPYEIDHILPEALVMDKSAPLTAADGQLLGVACCHRGGANKTKTDIQRIRKADRQRDRHRGALRSRNPMRGSKAHPLQEKRLFNGKVEKRT